ncbi:MAG TPA: EAL domain-containing response regulator [Acidobacteriaceae bacterium]
MTQQRILVIDDDSDFGELVCSVGRRLGHVCVSTTEPRTFFTALTSATTVIVLDLVMPHQDGIELLRKLAEQHCAARIIVTSGMGRRVVETAEALAASLGLEIAGYLLKPFRIEELESLLIDTRSVSSARRRIYRELTFTDDELHQAMREKEFILHYQPQIDLRYGNVVGVEALVRWQHPRHGLIYPDSFLGRLESANLIDQLGVVVSEIALKEMQFFASVPGGPLSMSINVSAGSLLDLHFPDTLLALMQRYGTPPERLTVEITENRLVQDLSTTLDVLSRLRMKGFQLSIDDFGIGYSMMQQMRQIPANELKIDKSFILKSETNDYDRLLVHKMIEIGQDLGMRVVAEGVSTEAQLEIVQRFQCDIAQGYLFSKPLPLETLNRWLVDFSGDGRKRYWFSEPFEQSPS